MLKDIKTSANEKKVIDPNKIQKSKSTKSEQKKIKNITDKTKTHEKTKKVDKTKQKITKKVDKKK